MVSNCDRRLDAKLSIDVAIPSLKFATVLSALNLLNCFPMRPFMLSRISAMLSGKLSIRVSLMAGPSPDWARLRGLMNREEGAGGVVFEVSIGGGGAEVVPSLATLCCSVKAKGSMDVSSRDMFSRDSFSS